MVLPSLSASILLVSVMCTVAIVIAIENRLAPGKSMKAPALIRRPADYAFRISVVIIIYLAFFSISARPFYSFGAALTFFTVFALISLAKVRFIREPLVFADLALLPLLLRHRELFYANWLGALFWLVAALYVFGASTLFFLYEPPLEPTGEWRLLALSALCLLALTAALHFSAGVRLRAGEFAARMLSPSDPEEATGRFGTFAYVVLHFLEWLGYQRSFDPLLAARRETEAKSFAASHAPGEPPPVVIVWQSESFIDMRRHGVTDVSLPTLDRLRARAVRHGLLDSLFEGGYTMRTEFSVLTGLPSEALGPDRFHPYLTASSYADTAWPSVFRKAGLGTVFLHPYDPSFFHRRQALPALGFQTLVMGDAFEHDVTVGPYVTDAALARRALEFCRQETGRGLFIFCASMENHGPWKADRVDDATEPQDIYLRILERSDAALDMLVEELDRLDRPVWLLFYGDHAPLLPTFGARPVDARTDYFILPAGSLRDMRAKSEECDTHPWMLIADVLKVSRAQGKP